MSQNIPLSPALRNHLAQQRSQLKEQVDRLALVVGNKEYQAELEILKLKSQTAVNHAQATRLPFFVAPGNVGNINEVIWPFWFATGRVDVAPDSQRTSGFSNTQEASFVILSYTKSVFLKTDPFNLQYLDPDAPNFAGKCPGLTIKFRDSQSTREFSQITVDADHVGHPRFPTELPAPMLVLPNSNIEVLFDNSHPTNEYVPLITFFGYKIRIEDARKLLSTVSG